MELAPGCDGWLSLWICHYGVAETENVWIAPLSILMIFNTNNLGVVCQHEAS